MKFDELCYYVLAEYDGAGRPAIKVETPFEDEIREIVMNFLVNSDTHAGNPKELTEIIKHNLSEHIRDLVKPKNIEAVLKNMKIDNLIKFDVITGDYKLAETEQGEPEVPEDIQGVSGSDEPGEEELSQIAPAISDYNKAMQLDDPDEPSHYED